MIRIPSYEAIVAALSSSIIDHECGAASDCRAAALNGVTAFVIGQQRRMPDYLRFPIALTTFLFDAWSIPLRRRPFRLLPPEERWKQICSWRVSRWSLSRDFITFYEALVVFGWYSEIQGQWSAEHRPHAT